MSGTSPRRWAVVLLTALLTAVPVVVWPSAALAEDCGILLLDPNAPAVDGHADETGRSVHLDELGNVSRHLPDRRPDPSFGDAGSRSLNDAVGADESQGWQKLALLELPSRVVAVGHRWDDFSAAVLVALTPDGDLDPAFGDRGVTHLDLPNAFAVAAAPAPDDGVVVLVREYGFETPWGVARVAADGILDPAFGEAGVAWVEDSVAGGPAGVLVHDDGRVVVSVRQVGEAADPARPPGVVALSSTGALLDGFGTGGQTPLPGLLEMRSGPMAATADGSTLLVGAGASSDGGGADSDVLVRVTPDGAVDPDFGTDGSVRFDGASEYFAPIDLAVDPGGRILYGRPDPADPSDVTVTRLDADGFLDTSFGADGLLRHAAADSEAAVGAVDPRSDGRLLVVTGDALLTVEEDGTLLTDCPQPGDPAVLRLAGTDRYSTPVEVSRWAFPAGAETVFVATGMQFPDALAAVPAATRASAPVLLVQKDAVPAVTEQELQRLDPERIVVLGGAAAISDAVLTRLRQHAGSVSRLAGTNRFETAAAISAATFAAGVDDVYVATGLNFPDALAGGAAAGLKDVPILLVAQNSIPDATARELARLSPASITVLGGETAVSDTVAQELGNRFSNGERPARIAGPSRYATAAQIGEQALDSGGAPPDTVGATVFLATGLNFPDALSAGSAAALNGAPLVLVPPSELIEVVRAALTRLQVSRVVILGGTGAVGDGVAGALEVPGQLRHLFSEMRSDREPVRWNPCEPIKWVWNPSNAPAGAFEDVKEAVSRVSAASGIPFAYEGESTEPARDSGSGYGIQRERYGNRPAPMLIAFGPLGGGFQIGLGGYTSVSDSWDGTGSQIFSGFVTLDSQRASWPTGFSAGDGTGPVLMHELGHALGLEHVDYADELMYPVSSDVLDLAAGDRRGLRTLGTGSPCLQPAAQAIEGLGGLRLTYVRRS